MTTSQLFMISRRDAPETQFGYRVGGRSRRHDRDSGRHRSSRSRSPKDRPPLQSFRRHSPTPEATPLSACPICLSRKRHPIRKCQATTLWNGQQKARCSRDEEGRIIDNSGRTLCNNWNQTVGCKDGSTRHIHECSGCGEPTHGAQNCRLAEKAQPTNPTRR